MPTGIPTGAQQTWVVPLQSVGSLHAPPSGRGPEPEPEPVDEPLPEPVEPEPVPVPVPVDDEEPDPVPDADPVPDPEPEAGPESPPPSRAVIASRALPPSACVGTGSRPAIKVHAAPVLTPTTPTTANRASLREVFVTFTG